MPLAPDMLSGTETIARRYVSDYVNHTAEGSTKVAYGAQSATAAIDAEGGDRGCTVKDGEESAGTHFEILGVDLILIGLSR